MKTAAHRTVLLISAIGLFGTAQAQHALDSVQHIREVEVVKKQGGRDQQAVQNLEVIGPLGLLKDACCNLSESFTNTAGVDVTYADAVSGAKEIRLLGLDGNYSQMMMENIPYLRGLGSTFGMLYMPGPWMNSIQVNKGAGSVVNGYESMTGQINIELKKPHAAELFYANLYVNQDARTELNLYTAHKMKNPKWAAAMLLHGNINAVRMDFNHDGFIDNPLTKAVHVMDRWGYQSGKLFNFIAAFNFLAEDREGGQMKFDFGKTQAAQSFWGMRLKTLRADAFAKTGFVWQESSLGVQYKYYFHQQLGFIGTRNYQAREHFGYLNLIYKHELPDETGDIKLGASFQTNHTAEQLQQWQYRRLELVPGAFAEVSYHYRKTFFVVGGLRADYHSLYGPFLSPRLQLKWNPLYALSIRASAGSGYHVPVLFAENYGLLSSNRTIELPSKITPERSWNYGGSISYKFLLDFREGNLSVDFYRTDFQNQLIVDLEDARLLRFYNLNGKSFSNSLQVEADYDVIRNFNVKVAYKFDDIRATYGGVLKTVPFRPKHKGLLALEYTTRKKHWRFNSSLTWYGQSRVPSTAINDAANQRAVTSKDYFLWNAQVTYLIKTKWEFYLGAENMLNQTQHNAIISNSAPNAPQFDASLVWGPLRGAMAFAGFRFKIN